MADPKIRFDVEANATGAAEVDRLAQSFTKLDDAVDPALATRAEAAARALRQIGEQQAAITAFERLSAETEAAAQDVATAGQKLDEFRVKLQAVADPTATQAGRLQKLEEAFRRTQTALESKSAALGEARGRLDQFGIPLDRVTTKQSELRDQLEATRSEVQQLGQVAASARGFEALASQTEDARVAVARTRAELDAYAAKLAGLDEITADQAQALQSLGAAAARAETDFARAGQAQAAAAQQARAAGVETDAITAAQQRARAATLASAEAARSASAAQLTAAQATADATREQSTAIAAGARSYTALVSATEDARLAVVRSDTALEQFRARMVGVQAPTAAQAATLEQLAGAARQAQIEFQRAASAQVESSAQMRRAGVDVDGITAAQQRARAATLGQAEASRIAAQAASQQAQAASTGAQTQVAAAQAVRGELTAIGSALRSIQALAGVALGGGLLAGTLGDVARTADAYTNLRSRIQLVTGEGDALQQAFDGIFAVATRTNSAVESTGTLFTRLAEAGKSAGLSTQQAVNNALALTETINQSIQVSGVSAASSDAAMQQLIQGLQSGVLRGEEFSSVMEQAPRLAKALADGLGVTTGELRKQAEAGRLTSEVVISALQGQAQVIQQEFSQLAPTVGRAVQNLSTEWTRYVGEVDSATGASRSAAEAINALATNLDTVGALLFAAGKAAAGYKAVQLAATFISNAQAAGQAAAAKAAETAATTANTTAQAANTAATAENTVAKRAASAEVGALGSAAGGAIGYASRLAGVFAALRGFTLAGLLTNLPEIGTWMGELAARTMGAKDRSDELNASWRVGEETARANAAATAALRQQQQQASDAALGLAKESRALVSEFEGVRAKGDSAADALAKLQRLLQLGDLSGIRTAGAALDALAIKGQISADQVRQALAGALKGDDLTRFEAQARAAFDGSEQGARRLAAALDAVAIESMRRAGTSAEELRTGFSAASTSAINDVDQLAASIDRLGLRGNAAANAMAASLGKAVSTAATTQAVDAVIQRYEALGAQGLITGDQLREGLEKARAKVDELTPGITGLREAAKAAGVDFQALQTGVSTGFEAGLRNVSALATEIGRAGIAAERAGPELLRAFDQQLAAARTTQEASALQQRIEEIIARSPELAGALGGALDAARSKAAALTPEMQRVAAAAKLLGVDLAANVQQGVGASIQAYELLKASGKASAEQVSAAFVKVANDATRAAGGIVPEWVKVEAGMRGVQ
uniref:tape measure protein n=1 Tax=Pseudorhodoferax sp. TaxID=1993553 RepID=UPI002DD6B0C9